MRLYQLPPGYKLIEPKTPVELDRYYQLRWEVLRRDWNRPKGSEKDDGEEGAIHAMIVDKNDKAIAVCRLQIPDKAMGQIRSMGVKAEHRGKGYGAIIISYLEHSAKQSGLSKIFLDARENAVAFYEQMGYKITEKSYLLFGEIQHWRMEKSL